jgi:hypothetical protein
MGVLSCVGADPGGKPFETFGKDSRNAQKAGARDDRPTGPISTRSIMTIAETVRSAPGRDLRMGALYGFFRWRQGKAPVKSPAALTKRAYAVSYATFERY